VDEWTKNVLDIDNKSYLAIKMELNPVICNHMDGTGYH
jgi:hypothetical protein